MIQPFQPLLAQNRAQSCKKTTNDAGEALIECAMNDTGLQFADWRLDSMRLAKVATTERKRPSRSLLFQEDGGSAEDSRIETYEAIWTLSAGFGYVSDSQYDNGMVESRVETSPTKSNRR